jgi:hypothetical protein
MRCIVGSFGTIIKALLVKLIGSLEATRVERAYLPLMEQEAQRYDPARLAVYTTSWFEIVLGKLRRWHIGSSTGDPSDQDVVRMLLTGLPTHCRV